METLRVPRRRFLKETGAVAGVQLAGASLPFPFSAITYNGQFPGPLLRFKEGRQVTIDIYNMDFGFMTLFDDL